MDPPKKSDNDGDSFMMAAIPRRSRPAPPKPSESMTSSSMGAARPAPDALENMSIPRRSLPKPQERSGSFVGGSSGAGSSHRRPSGGGSSHHHHSGHQQYHQQQQHHQQKQQHQSYEAPKPIVKPPKRVSIVSEHPFVIRIRMRGVPLNSGGIPERNKISFQDIPPPEAPEPLPPPPVPQLPPRSRSAAIVDDMDNIPKGNRATRAPKRARISYEEVGESDGLVDSEDEDESYAARPKKFRRGSQQGSTGRLNDVGQKAASAASVKSTLLSVAGNETPVSFLDSGSGGVVTAPNDGSLVEAPPPGMLSSLWYSRECYLHIFVVEKIVGWKRRTVTSLDWQDANALKFLDPQEATNLSQKALTNDDFWNDSRKRMEVSRINVSQCPVVMTIAAEREKTKALEMGVTPMYSLKSASDQKEEVLLVKWRGRSFLHCSWERPSDIIKLDPSNSTARHKIRRYNETQGKLWIDGDKNTRQRAVPLT